MTTSTSLSAGALRKLTRRLYEHTALVAVRKARQIVLFRARRGRTVIAASASLLLGTELAGVTLSVSEQATTVFNEACALRTGLLMGAAARGGKSAVQYANRESGRIYRKLPESFSVKSGLFRDIPGYSGLFRAIPGSAEVFLLPRREFGSPQTGQSRFHPNLRSFAPICGELRPGRGASRRVFHPQIGADERRFKASYSGGVRIHRLST